MHSIQRLQNYFVKNSVFSNFTASAHFSVNPNQKVIWQRRLRMQIRTINQKPRVCSMISACLLHINLLKYFSLYFQLNSDQFLNVDLLLEESMHALIIDPLTTRLRESLQSYYASTRTDTLNSTASNTSSSETSKLNTRDKNAFEDCMKQVNESLSPLDKLAHLLTAFKVISNAVCITPNTFLYRSIAFSNCVGRRRRSFQYL